MRTSVFITGNSSGLGFGLTRFYLEQGASVYGISRRGCSQLPGELHDIKCDLLQTDTIADQLDVLLGGVNQLDLVYLNAGVLGEIRKIAELDIQHMRQVMETNLWANKIILDHLLENNIRIKQVIGISTGATRSANIGWASYSLSKVAFQKLIELYAAEYPDTHFSSLAPGLVDTAIQAYLCDESQVPVDEYPAVKKMRDARGTDTMPTPYTAAQAIAGRTSQLLTLPSGSFADIRHM